MTDKPMQPLKICTVFDEEASGRGAQIVRCGGPYCGCGGPPDHSCSG